MKLTKKEIEELRMYKEKPDSDEIRCKEIIKQKLLGNRKILYVLDNKKLQKVDAPPDEYFGEKSHIIPCYMIPETQTDIRNYICYDVQFKELAHYNDVVKKGQIIFRILCEEKGLTETLTGLARHDLLAALIMSEFNWSNCFGSQIHCVSNEPSVVDAKYACRTLIFEMDALNSIVKTENGVTKVINSGVNR